MSVFYLPSHPDIMVELPCETVETCNVDENAFKGLASQWIGATIQAAPFTNSTLGPRLRSSAAGAAQQCSGDDNGTICGFKWTDSKWDGSSGVGQQLGAMNVLVANLVAKRPSANATAANATQTSGSSSGVPSSTSSQPAKKTNAASVTMQLPLVQALSVGVAVLLMLL